MRGVKMTEPLPRCRPPHFIAFIFTCRSLRADAASSFFLVGGSLRAVSRRLWINLAREFSQQVSSHRNSDSARLQFPTKDFLPSTNFPLKPPCICIFSCTHICRISPHLCFVEEHRFLSYRRLLELVPLHSATFDDVDRKWFQDSIDVVHVRPSSLRV